eukprot:893390-Pyramimonas_sp.AAC.1
MRNASDEGVVNLTDKCVTLCDLFSGELSAHLRAGERARRQLKVPYQDKIFGATKNEDVAAQAVAADFFPR